MKPKGNISRELKAEGTEQRPHRQHPLTTGSTARLIALVAVILGLWLAYQAKFQAGDLSKPVDALTPFPTSGLTPFPTETTDAKGTTMRLIPAGAFVMGGDPDRASAECIKLSGNCSHTYEDEAPPHEVYLDAYYIDIYEVTNALYKVCVDSSWCGPPGNSITSLEVINHYGDSKFDNYPVVHITWNQASAFCAWRGARLPSEAEWEKAARSTDGRTYPWGDAFDGEKTNVCDKNCKGGSSNPYVDDGYAESAPVGSFPQDVSPYGIYDLAGNVFEWTADWYDEKYYRTSPAINPKGPLSGEHHVKRGGSWWYSGNIARSAGRSWGELVYASYLTGFRCARSAP